jgi:hypothetical protein
MIPPRPMPEYPPLKKESDWQRLLKCSQIMLEQLQGEYGMPESDEQFHAVVHLIQTLAPHYFRRLH